jgi:hypothetical protein
VETPRTPISLLKQIEMNQESRLSGTPTSLLRRNMSKVVIHDDNQDADDKLRSVLGIAHVQSVMKPHSLAVVDSPLAPANARSSTGGMK